MEGINSLGLPGELSDKTDQLGKLINKYKFKDAQELLESIIIKLK